MSEAKLISECFVRPKVEVDESKRIHHLNPRDLRLLLVDNIQLGFLYTKPSTFDASSSFKRLTVSLSEALTHYYPLAGRFVTIPNQAEHSCVVYVDCAKGPGATIIHASAQDLTMAQVLNPDNSDISNAVESLFDMGKVTINHDGHTIPLLSVQLTELHDGVFMGICCNHSVADATSLGQFVRVWRNIFLGPSPSSDRLSIIKQPAFLQGRNFKLPYIDPAEFVIRPVLTQGEVEKTVFQFSPRSLETIKSIVNSEAKTRPISTFFALMAFAWRCITRVRKLSSNEVTTCVFFMDLRSQLELSLAKDYFGNYSVKASGSAKVSDLLCNNIGWAATLFKHAVADQMDKPAQALVLEALEEGLAPPLQTSRSANVIMAGGTKIDLTGGNFRFGRFVSFRTGNANKTEGKVSLWMGFAGNGAVDLEICLAPDTMSALLSDPEFMSFANLDTGFSNLTSKI